MNKYHVQIGNMNGQYNYKVQAEFTQSAKKKALQLHLAMGRVMKGEYSIYVAYRGRV